MGGAGGSSRPWLLEHKAEITSSTANTKERDLEVSQAVNSQSLPSMPYFLQQVSTS